MESLDLFNFMLVHSLYSIAAHSHLFRSYLIGQRCAHTQRLDRPFDLRTYICALCSYWYLLCEKPQITCGHPYTQDVFRDQKFQKAEFRLDPNTVLYTIKANNIILANLDPNQSLAGKLWGGPKEAVVVYGPFSKQNREDVLAAIDRLSPYPVKRTTLWGATRRLGFHTGH